VIDKNIDSQSESILL